jgi:Fe-S-cluster containining protein
MNESLTDALCTHCGLCCDGTLFADVELGRAEVTRLESMGLAAEEHGASAGLLSQPCAALQGRRCSIYAHRPKCCRTFECQLLQDARRGAVTVAWAREQIAEALERIRRVKELLPKPGPGDEHLPLKERYAEALADTTPGARRKHAALEAAMSGVETLIWATFLGDGQTSVPHSAR